MFWHARLICFLLTSSRLKFIHSAAFDIDSAAELEALAFEEAHRLRSLPSPISVIEGVPLTPKNASSVTSGTFWRHVQALSSAGYTIRVLRTLDLRLSQETLRQEKNDIFDIYFAAFWIGIKHESLHHAEITNSPFSIARAQEGFGKLLSSSSVRMAALQCLGLVPLSTNSGGSREVTGISDERKKQIKQCSAVIEDVPSLPLSTGKKKSSKGKKAKKAKMKDDEQRSVESVGLFTQGLAHLWRGQLRLDTVLDSGALLRLSRSGDTAAAAAAASAQASGGGGGGGGGGRGRPSADETSSSWGAALPTLADACSDLNSALATYGCLDARAPLAACLRLQAVTTLEAATTAEEASAEWDRGRSSSSSSSSSSDGGGNSMSEGDDDVEGGGKVMGGNDGNDDDDKDKGDKDDAWGGVGGAVEAEVKAVSRYAFDPWGGASSRAALLQAWRDSAEKSTPLVVYPKQRLRSKEGYTATGADGDNNSGGGGGGGSGGGGEISSVPRKKRSQITLEWLTSVCGRAVADEIGFAGEGSPAAGSSSNGSSSSSSRSSSNSSSSRSSSGLPIRHQTFASVVRALRSQGRQKKGKTGSRGRGDAGDAGNDFNRLAWARWQAKAACPQALRALLKRGRTKGVDGVEDGDTRDGRGIGKHQLASASALAAAAAAAAAERLILPADLWHVPPATAHSIQLGGGHGDELLDVLGANGIASSAPAAPTGTSRRRRRHSEKCGGNEDGVDASVYGGDDDGEDGDCADDGDDDDDDDDNDDDGGGDSSAGGGDDGAWQLFVNACGSSSGGVHVDALSSHHAVTLLAGTKEYVVFRPSDAASLARLAFAPLLAGIGRKGPLPPPPLPGDNENGDDDQDGSGHARSTALAEAIAAAAFRLPPPGANNSASKRTATAAETTAGAGDKEMASEGERRLRGTQPWRFVLQAGETLLLPAGAPHAFRVIEEAPPEGKIETKKGRTDKKRRDTRTKTTKSATSCGEPAVMLARNFVDFLNHKRALRDSWDATLNALFIKPALSFAPERRGGEKSATADVGENDAAPLPAQPRSGESRGNRADAAVVAVAGNPAIGLPPLSAEASSDREAWVLANALFDLSARAHSELPCCRRSRDGDGGYDDGEHAGEDEGGEDVKRGSGGGCKSDNSSNSNGGGGGSGDKTKKTKKEKKERVCAWTTTAIATSDPLLVATTSPVNPDKAHTEREGKEEEAEARNSSNATATPQTFKLGVRCVETQLKQDKLLLRERRGGQRSRVPEKSVGSGGEALVFALPRPEPFRVWPKALSSILSADNGGNDDDDTLGLQSPPGTASVQGGEAAFTATASTVRKQLVKDCRTADELARALATTTSASTDPSVDGEGGSSSGGGVVGGGTFFLSASAAPRHSLEALAGNIYRAHTAQLLRRVKKEQTGRRRKGEAQEVGGNGKEHGKLKEEYDAVAKAVSGGGAEWWVQAEDQASKEHRVPRGSTGVGFHFDTDVWLAGRLGCSGGGVKEEDKGVSPSDLSSSSPLPSSSSSSSLGHGNNSSSSVVGGGGVGSSSSSASSSSSSLRCAEVHPYLSTVTYLTDGATIIDEPGSNEGDPNDDARGSGGSGARLFSGVPTMVVDHTAASANQAFLNSSSSRRRDRTGNEHEAQQDNVTRHSQQRRATGSGSDGSSSGSGSSSSSGDGGGGDDDGDCQTRGAVSTGGRRVWLSWPSVGKHLAFDGSLLHGAPPQLRVPLATHVEDEEDVADDEEEDAGPVCRPRATEAARVVLVVNVWVGKAPWAVPAFPAVAVPHLSNLPPQALVLALDGDGEGDEVGEGERDDERDERDGDDEGDDDQNETTLHAAAATAPRAGTGTKPRRGNGGHRAERGAKISEVSVSGTSGTSSSFELVDLGGSGGDVGGGSTLRMHAPSWLRSFGFATREGTGSLCLLYDASSEVKLSGTSS